MTFGHPWMLLAALAPVLWAAIEWRRTPRHAALALKAAAFFSILLALAQPALTVSESKVALAILVDTSASVSPQDLSRASGIATRMESERGRNSVQVIPFARTGRGLRAGEDAGRWKLEYASGEAGRATDLESAIREGIGSLPAGTVPRVVLISDGKQNEGSVARAAWQARQLGVPIDTIAMRGRERRCAWAPSACRRWPTPATSFRWTSR